MVAQIRYSVAERLRGRVALCVICTVYVETRSVSFLIEPQNQGRQFVSDLKTTVAVFSGLTSKQVATVSWLSLKTKVVEGFSIWASKPVATVW
jgi:hypothetical protein